MSRLLILLAFSLAVETVCGEAVETQLHAKPQLPRGSFTRESAPEFELVVARYNENASMLAWLADVPEFYQITIINKVYSHLTSCNCGSRSAL